MIEVRMDRAIRDWSVALFIFVMFLGMHNAIFPQNLFVEGIVSHVRLALIVWVCPVAISFTLLNFYESMDLLFEWEQSVLAADRFIKFLGGVLTTGAAFVLLGTLS